MATLKKGKIPYKKKETKEFRFKMLINIPDSSRKGNVLTSYISVVVTERLIDHIGSEKTPMRISTAVRNLGQWPNG